jgi:hypothetical protein
MSDPRPPIAIGWSITGSVLSRALLSVIVAAGITLIGAVLRRRSSMFNHPIRSAQSR